MPNYQYKYQNFLISFFCLLHIEFFLYLLCRYVYNAIYQVIFNTLSEQHEQLLFLLSCQFTKLIYSINFVSAHRNTDINKNFKLKYLAIMLMFNITSSIVGRLFLCSSRHLAISEFISLKPSISGPSADI